MKYTSRMFDGCYKFNQPLGSWDVSNVITMDSMFCDCHNFNQPLNSWDVSNVTDMSSMFYNCHNFNQPLDDWNVENVRDMSCMFCNCHNFNQSLEKWGWGVSKVEIETAMFEGCRSLKTKPSWYEWLEEKCQDEFDDEYDGTLE